MVFVCVVFCGVCVRACDVCACMWCGVFVCVREVWCVRVVCFFLKMKQHLAGERHADAAVARCHGPVE
jgi:hypothetical protein